MNRITRMLVSVSTLVSMTFCFMALNAAHAAQTKIKVNRHTSTTITDAEAKSILENGSAALTIEGTAARCGLSLTLDPPVSSFSVGTGQVSSGAAYSQVCQTGGYIHVVRSITVCGGQAAAPGYTIIGCSDTPGSCEELVRLDDPKDEQSLWMHEYGHTKGLQHRNGAKLLMNPSLDSSDQFVVSQAECSAMKSSPSMGHNENKKAQLQPEPDAKAGGQHGETPSQPESIREFVSKMYFEGLPLDQARTYKASDVPVLLAMLDNPKEAKYWPNVVAVLGVIGGEEVIEPLTSFLNKETIEAPRSTYRAKLQVQVSLGYMVHERHSERALELLKKGVDPQNWTKSHTLLPGTTEEVSAMQLAASSILGLGASGDPEALKFLQQLKQKVPFTAEPLSNALQDAVRANERIAKYGLH
jgi:hypothetical protein